MPDGFVGLALLKSIVSEINSYDIFTALFNSNVVTHLPKAELSA